jgi:hypothetical protein
MAAFSIVVVSALWYVDYKHFRLVGLGIRPFGYDSPAQILLREIFYTSCSYYRYGYTNLSWALSQLLPVFFSWHIRLPLGRGTQFCAMILRRLYAAA